MEGEIKTWIAERGLIKAALTRFKKFCETLPTDTTIAALKKRLDANKGLYDRFDSVQQKIELAVSNTDAEAAHYAERDHFETAYFNIMAQVEDYISSRQGSSRASPAAASTAVSELQSHIKLPTISLPPFDGDYNDWLKFRDTFESLIHHNETLNNVQRFHYLSSALKGNAARTIQTLGVSDANYALAWKALKDRYENSRRLIRHHGEALLHLPAQNKDSPESLRVLLDDMNSHLSALGSLGEPVTHWDTLVVLSVSEKLDPRTKREWDRLSVGMSRNPNLSDLRQFLEEQSSYLEQVANSKSAIVPRSDKKLFSKGKSRDMAVHTATSSEQCVHCRGSHMIFACEGFKALDMAQRRDIVQKLQLCYNCLRQGHGVKNCTRQSCKQCGGKHHSLLHRDAARNLLHNSADVSANKTASTSTASQSIVVNMVEDTYEHAVLSTAIVSIRDAKGKLQHCRVLLDSGSQVNLIRESFVKKLGLPCSKINLSLKGLGGREHFIKYKANLEIHSLHNNFRTHVSCLAIENITEPMPNVPLDKTNFVIPEWIKLADPQFKGSRDIDMLLGAGLYLQLLCIGQHKLGLGGLILQKTHLGWILGGRFNLPNKHHGPVCQTVSNTRLDNALTKFWEIESDINKRDNVFIDPSDKCEQHFLRTVVKLPNGRYSVKIPFKENVSQLGQSRDQAEKRLLSLEKRLQRQPTFQAEYKQFMKDYELLGHMTPIPESAGMGNTGYYLPHHAVYKATSTTTKLRVVFDGSANTSSGLSLNDTQFVGPTVQSDLFSIVVRFRKHRFVMSADIEKMYRQIEVDSEERKFQRILWRSDKDKRIQTFELNTVTYGTASAPFLATRVLRQVGIECAEKSPTASDAIINDFYIDDLLTGSNNLTSAMKLKTDITTILADSGFNLRKWSSNNERLVPNIQNESVPFNIQVDYGTKILGLLWAPASDQLRYAVTSAETKRVTKRTILSDIAKIFDPLGLVSPIIVNAKLIMQRLWQLHTGWDESVPQDLYSQWKSFCDDLPHLKNVFIPRRILCNAPKTIELHGFCDASERAYGACIYLRSQDATGSWSLRLVCSKSRVAPLKSLTIPRLELCGALLLAQLTSKIRSSLKLKINREYFWSDSMVALAWIKASPSRWSTFVRNRVSEIQELTDSEGWRHVTSQDNPSDLISRGASLTELINNDLWWSGPQWLTQSIELAPYTEIAPFEIPEKRQKEVSLISTHTIKSDIFNRFSSFTRLLRVISYCLRWITKIRIARRDRLPENTLIEDSVIRIENNQLTSGELENTRKLLVRLAQREHFLADMQALQSGNQVTHSSQIRSLNPFLDTEGILRVGGRIRYASIPYDHKHPMILPSKHRLTILIIEHEHLRLLHAGCQHVMSSIRTRYWPLMCKGTVKSVLRKCIRCFRFKPTKPAYVMSDLPAARVTPARAFYTSGVDYAGPFCIKEKTRSRITVKAYVCMFVCFVTKAVHIELATDLSTDAFLNCLRRFISRRGLCHCIYSDNGTNFVGARNELTELKALLDSKDHNKRVRDYLSKESIQWNFIPAHSPHFGGLWERAIRSTKYHIRRVVGEQRLTFEELYTLLTQIEACLNSRPLYPMSDNSEDLDPLTPGHFLVGESLKALPDTDLRDIKQNRLSRYQLIQQMLQHFWRRWQREYLHHLQQRHKWRFSDAKKISRGMLVLVREDNLPPLQWRLGRIVDTHCGSDGVIRVVSLKMNDTVVKRPVTKISLLPIDEEESISSDSVKIGY